MADINTWIAMGRPRTKTWRSTGYVYTLPVSSDNTSWKCDTLKERQASPADRQLWYELKPGCKGNYGATEGLAYSPSAQGFIGSGVERPPDSFIPSPITSPTLPAPEAAPAQVSTANFPGVGGGVFPGEDAGLSFDLGSPKPSTVGGVVASLVPSVCKGPYNRKGTMCVPKPDCKIRDPSDPCVAYSLVGGLITDGIGIGSTGGPGATGLTDPGYTNLTGGDPCPTGYSWDGQQCVATGIGGAIQRALPGGQTGTGVDVYGAAVMGAFGRPALQPYVYSQPVRRCPPGLVLGKDGLCYDKIANKDRMWPRGPRPFMTGADMKALRRAASLKNRVKKLAQDTGWSCRKK